VASTKESDLPPAANFVVGPRDSIEQVDDAACVLLGYSRAELLRMHGSDLVPVERHGRTAVSLDRMRDGELVFRDGVLKRKDGTLVVVAVEAQVLGEGRLRLTVRERRTA
jgi:PAS domain S-box-containing protein